MQKESIKRKAEQVDVLAEKLGRAQTVVAFDYPGLTVEAFTKLRTELRNANCEMAIYKNNISRRASIAAGYEDFAETLVGAKAIAMSYEDVVAPAKIVYEFAKDNKQVVIQSGVVEGKVASIDVLNELATLPSYDMMLTMLAGGLLAPIRDLTVGLHMISEEA